MNKMTMVPTGLAALIVIGRDGMLLLVNGV